MNLHILDIFRPKPDRSHKERRYYAATKAENKAARQRRADTRMELEIMAIHLTPEQREAAKSRATQWLMRVVGRVG
jgi:hypothetical protein